MKKAWILFLALFLLHAPAARAEELPEPNGDDLYEEKIPAQPDEPAAAGDWYADLDGRPVHLRLNADGTYELSLPGEASGGIWTQEDDVMILDGAEAYPLNLIGDGLLASEESEMMFTREDPGIYVPEAPVPEAEPGWFAGYWKSAWADGGGMPVPAWTVGDNTDVFFDGTLAALGGRRFGDIWWNCTFENGQMSARMEDGRTVVFSFQRDGLLRMTAAEPEGETTLWLAPAWSAALDGEDDGE